ncbi:F-box/LRR-repeat protein [Carex littledalei]|uniref:F-box/LRR-repeat protein n=1 Tax=Carex littledalei TaxID=544730 RepID=A0A833RDS8_9POAL|nr:F-box/LRR-repeat protein [Carex littledalei]
MGQLLKFLRERFQMETRRSNNTSQPPDDIDRISNLPEELRVQILSFLTTNEAMTRCLLSKTWKNTLASVPILFFSFGQFLLDNHVNNVLSGEIIREYEDEFAKFVKSVLQKRKASDALSHFVLVSVTKNCVSCNSEAFKDCILHALEFKPRFLAVCFCKHHLPSSYEIFTCASLHEVCFGSKLEDRDIEIAPNSVNLPRLKRLDLCNVTVNDDFLDKLFLGCPIIEELFLDSCILTASRISSGTLKRLGLLCCDFSRSGPELLNSLSKFTRLTLTVPGTEVKGLFEKGVPHWPIFKNLKRLRLGGWCLNSNFSLVSFFLRSPNLEQLTLHGGQTQDKSNWEVPKVEMIQRERLEKVNIMKQGRSAEWIDQLKKNLYAHVKTIGEINIVL